MKGIDRKRVLVTGAVQGIGRAVAERFLSEGASVLLTDAAPAEVINDVVDSLEDRYPGLAFGTRIDIQDEKQVVDGFRYMQEVLGGCDIFAFLASDDAAYITGQTIYVDGGLTLHIDFKNNWSS